MIDWVFDHCVVLLQFCASKLGITYEAINVWFFCLLWPLLTTILVMIIIYQRRLLRRQQHTASREHSLSTERGKNILSEKEC